MKQFWTNFKFIFCFITIIFFTPQYNVGAQDTVGLTVNNQGVNFFATSAASYYGYPTREVVVLPQYGIIEEEIPVALFIAKKARVKPLTIVNLRKSGLSWMTISNRYHISPADFYFPYTSEISSPPYGKAYGYYRNRPRNEWHNIVMDDDDIVNLVNLRFISNSRHVSPVSIVELRGKGNHFPHIYETVKIDKPGRAMYIVHKEHPGKSHGKHKNKH